MFPDNPLHLLGFAPATPRLSITVLPARSISVNLLIHRNRHGTSMALGCANDVERSRKAILVVGRLFRLTSPRQTRDLALNGGLKRPLSPSRLFRLLRSGQCFSGTVIPSSTMLTLPYSSRTTHELRTIPSPPCRRKRPHLRVRRGVGFLVST